MDDIHTLRWGYNLADVDRLTRLSLYRWNTHLDWRTRYELAWSAIAEALYAAAERPVPEALMHAAQDAIGSHVDADCRAHGWDREFHRPAPRFAVYWDGQRHDRDPHEGLIERLALWQIWEELTPASRRAILALAATGTQQAAAASLGVSLSGFKHALERGRRQFFALWLEHETPSGCWGLDRRVYRTGGPALDSSYRKAAKAIRHRQPRVEQAPRKPRHGTLREYNWWGCRCTKCTERKTEESRRRRRRKGVPVRALAHTRTE
jgi:hypothetical protein